MSTEEEEPQEWYVRRGVTVQGPYREEDVRRYLLLGRLRLSDRVSADAHCWQPLTQRAELIPEEMRDLESEAGRANFEAARRAVDERARDRDVVEPAIPAAAPASRLMRLRRHGYVATLAIVFAVVALAGIGYYRDFDAGAGETIDCAAVPARGVVWSGCVKDGIVIGPAVLAGLQAINASLRGAGLNGADLRDARLDYADLSLARLSGADLEDAVLRGADLAGADLTDADLAGADLRFADLRSARIDGARLEGAMLDRALWVDGRACGPDSIGRCRR